MNPHRVDNERLYAYVLRLQEGEVFDTYVDMLPEDRRAARVKYEGPNRRQVIDLKYFLGRVMPTGHDFTTDPTGDLLA